jgi:sirohydrochlorin cobaltochelatase
MRQEREPEMTSQQGLLLFAHGARDPQWARPFEQVAQALKVRHPHVPLRLAFLELMTPSFGEAAASLAEEGCTRIDVLPLFLGAGGHVRRDLPALVEAARSAHPGCEIYLHPALGESQSAVQAIAAWASSTALP